MRREAGQAKTGDDEEEEGAVQEAEGSGAVAKPGVYLCAYLDLAAVQVHGHDAVHADLLHHRHHASGC